MTEARRPSPQVRRLSRGLDGQSANLRDYCAADSRRIDTQCYQELIDLRPSTIIYPADAALVLDKPILLRSGQTHNFASGSRIDAEVGDFAMVGTGKTGQNIGSLVRAIPRYARMVFLERPPEVSVGDVILLVDVARPKDVKIDINMVEGVDGGVIATRYEIGRPFADTEAFRIYKVYDPLKDLRILGKVACANHHRSGGFLRLTNALHTQIRGLIVENAGYIGLSFESSLRGQFEEITVRGAGASGLGVRASKEVIVDGFVARNVRADESLTFYDNVSHVKARNISIEQYLYQEKKDGQSAGNNILIDLLCSKVELSDVTCVSSSTYNIMINNQCDDCSVSDFILRKSNLGGIRVSSQCRNTRVGPGIITDVTDLFDQEGRKPVSAISIGSTCAGTSISKDIAYDRISSGLRLGVLRDRPS